MGYIGNGNLATNELEMGQSFFDEILDKKEESGSKSGRKKK